MFVGRKDILADLETLWRKKTSSIVACRGRRRIGKSTLFREFAKRTADRYLEIEGLPPCEESKILTRDQLNQKQLDNFIDILSGMTGCSDEKVTNWFAAFKRLDEQIDETCRTVILLDEISWMGQYDADFPGRLRTAWETLFHRHEKLIVVVCGSISAWIKDNILGNTGFTGRFSRDYVLGELTLSECAEFWGVARERILPREIFDVLSVTGGVPRYLEEVDPGLSADENIRRMCFLKTGELFNDFNAIFNPIFGAEVALKKRILQALSDGPLTGAEISRASGIGRNGRLAKLMRDLTEGGFVSDDQGKNPETGAELRVGSYRLRDNYTRFYLKFIEPHKEQIDAGAFELSSLEQLEGLDGVMGLAFENLVVNNYASLLPLFHLSGALVAAIRRPEGVSAKTALVHDGHLSPVARADGYFDAIISSEELLGLS